MTVKSAYSKIAKGILACIVSLTHTCLKCKDKGLYVKYWGESSESTYERSKTYIDEGIKKYKTRHINQHIEKFHKGEDMNIHEDFKFEMVQQIKGAMNKQPVNIDELKGYVYCQK